MGFCYGISNLELEVYSKVNIWFLHVNIYGGLACKFFICVMLSIVYLHGIKIHLYLDLKGTSV